MILQDQTFDHQDIELDFIEYHHCVFNHCKILYRGYGPAQLGENTFNSCEFYLVDGARRTMEFLADLYHGLGAAGRELIESTFDTIRAGSVAPEQLDEAATPNGSIDESHPLQ